MNNRWAECKTRFLEGSETMAWRTERWNRAALAAKKRMAEEADEARVEDEFGSNSDPYREVYRSLADTLMEDTCIRAESDSLNSMIVADAARSARAAIMKMSMTQLQRSDDSGSSSGGS